MNLKHCLNWKVGAGLGVIALAVVILAPNLIGRLLPLLLLAVCPLSMLVMMAGMGKMQGGHKTGEQHDEPSAGSTTAVLSPPPALSQQVEPADVAALKAQAARLAAQQEQLNRDIARLETAAPAKERV